MQSIEDPKSITHLKADADFRWSHRNPSFIFQKCAVATTLELKDLLRFRDIGCDNHGLNKVDSWPNETSPVYTIAHEKEVISESKVFW